MSGRRFDLETDDPGPGVVAIAFAAISFVLVFAALTPPGYYTLLLYGGILIGVLVCIAWLVELLQARRARFMNASMWRFLVMPVLLLTVIVCASLDVPFKVAFALSRGDMNRTAAEVMSGKRSPSSISWIGVYPVSQASGDRFGFWFQIAGTSELHGLALGRNDCYRTMSGFSYGNSSKLSYRDSALRQVSGHWWAFSGNGGCDCCGA